MRERSAVEHSLASRRRPLDQPRRAGADRSRLRDAGASRAARRQVVPCSATAARRSSCTRPAGAAGSPWAIRSGRSRSAPSWSGASASSATTTTSTRCSTRCGSDRRRREASLAGGEAGRRSNTTEQSEDRRALAGGSGASRVAAAHRRQQLASVRAGQKRRRPRDGRAGVASLGSAAPDLSLPQQGCGLVNAGHFSGGTNGSVGVGGTNAVAVGVGVGV